MNKNRTLRVDGKIEARTHNIFRAFNVQLPSLACIIEKWTEDDVAELGTEVYISKFKTVSTGHLF